MIKKWLEAHIREYLINNANVWAWKEYEEKYLSFLDRRISSLEKPKSIKDIHTKLRATMKDGDKEYKYTVHRIKGRFAKRPK